MHVSCVVEKRCKLGSILVALFQRLGVAGIGWFSDDLESWAATDPDPAMHGCHRNFISRHDLNSFRTIFKKNLLDPNHQVRSEE